MINWDELKHIHVIRKLEEILAQWFHTDIFFMDERGSVRNYDRKEFKNPLSNLLLPKERGKQWVMRAFAEANERAFQSKETHFVMKGPGGFENLLVSRITIDNEF